MQRPRLILIAAVSKNNVIGKDGTIPWYIPEEMILFQALTMNHPVIVGRVTYESIGKPLPGRKTIVVSTTLPPSTSEELAVSPSLEEALEHVSPPQTAFVIGGQQIYAQMMPFADELYISHLNEAYEGDSFFPPILGTEWNKEDTIEFPRFTHSRYLRI